MVRIYLTRHGQTEWNVELRMQGQLDSALTELGVRQTEALGIYLSNVDFSVIYASSSARAIHSAELIRGNRPLEIIPEDDLREISLGSWEGRLFSETEFLYPKMADKFWNHPEQYIPPNGDGETFEELRSRVGKKLDEIAQKHQGETILVVTHGVALKTLYAYFRYQSIGDIANSPSPQPACLCLVEKKHGIWNIMRWNERIITTY